MAQSDLSFFKALTTKMQWLQSRQGILARNVAHANTPGAQAQDLKKLKFDVGDGDGLKLKSVSVAQTHSGHMTLSGGSSGQIDGINTGGFEVTPSGNAISLESEMIKVVETAQDYRAAVSLYKKGQRLLKLAVGVRN